MSFNHIFTLNFRYEERYGYKDLPWNKWIIYIEGDENWNPDESKWKKDKTSKWKRDKRERKKITFKSVFQTIVLSKAIKTGIEGIMKGRMVVEADLPFPLEFEVARQTEATIPKKVRYMKPKSEKNCISLTLISETCQHHKGFQEICYIQ